MLQCCRLQCSFINFVVVNQAEDVDLMVERMEEQMKQLTKAYREELTQTEVCF